MRNGAKAMLHIQTPATTANVGPGFDCIGVALQMYNHLWVEETESGLRIENRRRDVRVPLDGHNLVYASILRFYKETGIQVPFKGIHLIQEDHIPQTRGLGSSAACIVSGLTAANALAGNRLSKPEIAEMAAIIEGHPDNAAPAVLGGMVVAAMTNSRKLEYVKLDTTAMTTDGITFGVMVPDFPLSTGKARKALPDTYSRADVVFNTSRAALMVAAVLTKDYDRLMTAMDDRIHQPYRSAIIPGMDEIFEKAKAAGALGVFLSGAGPTLVAVYKGTEARSGIMACLRSMKDKWILLELPPDMEGAQVKTL